MIAIQSLAIVAVSAILGGLIAVWMDHNNRKNRRE
jgi:hypothetical protein